MDTMAMERKCFVQDEDSHWYCIPVDSRSHFDYLLEKLESTENQLLWLMEFDKDNQEAYEATENECAELWKQWNEEFEPCRLAMAISNYSFLGLEEAPR